MEDPLLVAHLKPGDLFELVRPPYGYMRGVWRRVGATLDGQLHVNAERVGSTSPTSAWMNMYWPVERKEAA